MTATANDGGDGRARVLNVLNTTVDGCGGCRTSQGDNLSAIVYDGIRCCTTIYDKLSGVIEGCRGNRATINGLTAKASSVKVVAVAEPPLETT